ncbi:MAG: FxsA family protein, partial [Ketobacter sp.]|nr:FxsA family protein [Ketobacter sp.]
MGFGRVFIFIFVFALLEAIVLGQVAQSIGWAVTILLTVLTAMMGSLLFRWQGVETWIRLNKRMQQGEMPGAEMVEGVMLLLGGALLITPGFITDAVGFLLLLPQSRKAFASYVVKKGMMQAFTRGPGQGNVWVSGTMPSVLKLGSTTVTTRGSLDIFVAQLAKADGSVLWAGQAGGKGWDSRSHLHILPSGDPILTGSFQQTADLFGKSFKADGPYDAFIVRIDKATG